MSHSTPRSARPRLRTQVQSPFRYPPPLPEQPERPQQTVSVAAETKRPSARSTYPHFLSIQETALLQLRWAWRGLCDSFRWDFVFSTVAGDEEISHNVYKSLALNSISLFSIYSLDLLFDPVVKNYPKLGWFYRILWLLPIVGISLYLNGTWCTTIAQRTYLLQHGGRLMNSSSSWQPQTYTSLLRSIATSGYRFVMVCTSVVVGFVLGRVPFVGWIAEFGFMCWVDAYYCFEFVWISRGYPLSKRIRLLEERWAYYFAFGLPSTAMCMWGSTPVNVALFALIFPAYIIMAMRARPLPIDPYNPSISVTSKSGHGDVDDQAVVRHPSPFIPIRVPVFALVIWINDAIVRMLNTLGGRPVRQGHRHSLSSDYKKGRYSRRDSDAEESAEDGKNVL